MTWPSPYQNDIREIRSLSNFKGEKKGNKRMALYAILHMSPRIYKCLGVEDPLLRNGPFIIKIIIDGFSTEKILPSHIK